MFAFVVSILTALLVGYVIGRYAKLEAERPEMKIINDINALAD